MNTDGDFVYKSLDEVALEAAEYIYDLRYSSCDRYDLAVGIATLARQVGRQMDRLGVKWADLEAVGNSPVWATHPDMFPMTLEIALERVLMPVIKAAREG